MGYGYGRNDLDNWPTDAWGRPFDPDEPCDTAASDNRPVPPPRKVPPMNLYGASVACIDDCDHNINGDSGYGKCSRCGFAWRRLHTALGYAIVGTGAIVLEVVAVTGCVLIAGSSTTTSGTADGELGGEMVTRKTKRKKLRVGTSCIHGSPACEACRPTKIVWESNTQFGALVGPRNERKLGVTVATNGGEWVALALEGPIDFEHVLDDHAHQLLGRYAKPGDAFQAAEAFARQWLAGENRDQVLACACADIQKPGPTPQPSSKTATRAVGKKRAVARSAQAR